MTKQMLLLLLAAAQKNKQMPLLLLAAATHYLILLDGATAVAEQPIALPGCPDKCGDISVPYPFGMKPGCFREGLQVTCDHSFDPPRAFLPESELMYQLNDTMYFSMADGSFGDISTSDATPVEIFNISAAESQAWSYGSVTSFCSLNSSYGLYKSLHTKLGPGNTFRLSPERNVVVGVGSKVLAAMMTDSKADGPKDEITFFCVSNLEGNMQLASDGSCMGRGCCMATLPPAPPIYINECDFAHLNNCSRGSICKNKPGGYDCPCMSTFRFNRKEGRCEEISPLAAKVPVGVAAFIVVLVVLVLAHQLLKLKRFYEQNGGPILKGVKNIRIYTRKQLKHITNNYKHIIGEGQFGKVFLGTLKDNQKVAIKKSIELDEERKKEFTEEVIIQSGMRHKNIVRLLGCCLQMDVPMLVYEFVAKGSLYDVLFKKKDNIPVDTRLKIAIGSAEGLAYMHSAVESTIRHGDVKSANILLDENFTPKVSDFGTSRLLAKGKSEKTDWVIGDKGYIDPIYMMEGVLTQKSDVYSFGIVLIELITRRVATYDDKRSYVTNFVQACHDKRVVNFVDNDITSEEDIKILEMVSQVAVQCLKSTLQERLDMKQVEQCLRNIRQSTQHARERNYQGSLSPAPEDVAFLG